MAAQVVRAPRFGDVVELTTFCSGYGSRFAERRTSVTIDGQPAIEAVALWVSVDPASGRPAAAELLFALFVPGRPGPAGKRSGGSSAKQSGSKAASGKAGKTGAK